MKTQVYIAGPDVNVEFHSFESYVTALSLLAYAIKIDGLRDHLYLGGVR